MGKGLYERYRYYTNIADIPVNLWGYVSIWYLCGDGSIDVKGKTINGIIWKIDIK